MKKFMMIVVLPMLGICSCKNERIERTSLYVFLDISSELNKDDDLLVGSVPAILNKIGVDTVSGGLSGGEVKFFLLGETSRSPFETIQLASGRGGLMDERTNKYIRSEEVKGFRNDLVNTFRESLYSQNWGRDNSKIYQQLCRQLKSLNDQISDKKVIVIYSDMLENSNLFSFYKRKLGADINQVKKWLSNDGSFEKALQILSKDCELPDLSQIEIHIVSNRNRKNDDLINLSEQFWTKLFSVKGSTKITHGAELSF